MCTIIRVHVRRILIIVFILIFGLAPFWLGPVLAASRPQAQRPAQAAGSDTATSVGGSLSVRYVAPGGECGGTTPNCYATFQAAVDAASPGDEIRIAGGTYSGVMGRPRIDVSLTGLVTQVVYLDRSLTLMGGYTITDWSMPDPGQYPTIIDAGGQGRGVYAAGDGVIAHLKYLTIQNGNATGQGGKPTPGVYDAGGGIYSYRAALDLEGCTIRTSKASSLNLALGGGLFAYQGAGVWLDGVTILQNVGSTGAFQGYGGGLGAENTPVTIVNSQVLSNTGANTRGGMGGGLHITEGSLVIELTELRGNRASNSGTSTHVGHGGAVYGWDTMATISQAQITGNTGVRGGRSEGGALSFRESDVTMMDSMLTGNIGSTGEYGKGGALYIYGDRLVLLDNHFTDNTGSTGSYGNGGAIYIQSTGSTANPVLIQNNLVADNLCSQNDTCIGAGLYVDASAATITGNTIENNIGNYGIANDYGQGGGIYLHSGSVTLDRNLIRGNRASNHPDSAGRGGGIYASSLVFTFTNNIIADNYAAQYGSGVFIQFAYQPAAILHNTIASSGGVDSGSGQGVYLTGLVPGEPPLPLTNNIIAGYPVAGVAVANGASANLDSTLWHDTPLQTSGDGVIVTINDYTGEPLFVDAASGDFHIQVDSAAIDKATPTFVSHDFDLQTRPNGAASDLGADEFQTSPSAAAAKAAFAPQWQVSYDPLTGAYSHAFHQRYLITFQHTDPAPAPVAYTFRVTDTLPAGLLLDWWTAAPPMARSSAGNQQIWETLSPLASGNPAQLLIGTTGGGGAVPGMVYVNEAVVQGVGFAAKHGSLNLEAVTQVPLFPPVILEPGNGEKCSEPGGMVVKGFSVPGELVEVYLDDQLIGTAQVDVHGLFTATTSATSNSDVPHSLRRRDDHTRRFSVLVARTCSQSDPGTCGVESSPVYLTPARSFFCPQVSTWVDTPDVGPYAGQQVTYRFRDAAGWFVTQNWRISAPLTFKDTVLKLKFMGCPDFGGNPTTLGAIWVTIEDVGTFDATSQGNDWYQFQINVDVPTGEREVGFYASCVPLQTSTRRSAGEGLYQSVETGHEISSTAVVSIHPLGAVHDALNGAPVEGAEVTLMLSNTAWGGWTPWPGAPGSPDSNPQTTGAAGTFSFLAPPGEYFLQVTPPPGYQPYRSPVLVSTAAYTIALTPIPAAQVATIHITPAGLVPDQRTIGVGEVVAWVADIAPSATISDRLRLVDYPEIHLMIQAQPPALGQWDAGMLIPGSIYRLPFLEAGSYTFHDGRGHTGVIHVRPDYVIYLPLLMR